MRENKNGNPDIILYSYAVLLLIYVGSLFCFIKIKNSIPVTPIVLTENEIIEENSKPAMTKSLSNRIQNSNGTEIVAFNPKSLKFHNPDCNWAKKCKRCIRIKKSEAVKRGGVPCKVCGNADNSGF